MSTASISIDRTGMPGAPSPIVMTGSSMPYRLTENGVGYVTKTLRVATATDSGDINGIEITGFSYDASSLPLELFVIGATWADVQTAVDDLEAALFRVSYEITRTVEGVTQTFLAGPAALVPVRQSVQAEIVDACFDTFGVTIPLPYPLPI